MKKKGYTMTKHGVIVDDHEGYKQGKNVGSYPPRAATEEAFHEVKHNKPAAIKHTEKKFGKKRAKRQQIAIALSKARKGK